MVEIVPKALGKPQGTVLCIVDLAACCPQVRMGLSRDSKLDRVFTGDQNIGTRSLVLNSSDVFPLGGGKDAKIFDLPCDYLLLD